MSTQPRTSARINKGKPPARYGGSVSDSRLESRSAVSTSNMSNEQQPQTQPRPQEQLLTSLVEQISALKESVEQLRNDTSVTQAETQRLREAVNRQVECGGLAINPCVTQERSVSSESGTQSTLQSQPSETGLTVVHHSYKKLYDLPFFSGKPDDWPLFLANFEETTSNFQYSAMENTIRLQKCLQGEAREAVSSLLIHPNNVDLVIKTLTFRFGRPDLLIKAQLLKVQQFPAINEARVDNLIPFATMVENVVAFLVSAKCEQHLANPTLLDELVTKLPMTKKFDWARYALDIRPYPTVKNFSAWLTELAKVVQLIPQGNTAVVTRTQPPHHRRLMHTTERKSNEARTDRLCVCCGSSHQVSECELFKELANEDRWKLVKSKHLCFSCIKPGHGTASCRSRKRCDENGCRRYHHKLLHQGPENVSPSAPSRLHNCRTPDHSGHLFRILPVILSGPRGEKRIYAMFDEGSSLTILEDNIARELGFTGKLQSLALQWFGDKVVNEPSRTVTIDIRGVERGSLNFSMKNVRTVPNLGLPIQSFNKKGLHHLENIPVNDYNQVRPVLLIGLDNCHLGAPISAAVEGNRHDVIATHTKLGWIVYGPRGAEEKSLPVVLHVRENHTLGQIDKLVNSYFTVENFGVCKSERVLESDDDTRAKRIMEETTHRIGKRFETGLLWRHEKFSMPDSLKMAIKRLHNIENKMRREPEFAEQYRRQISNYITKGYAEELSPSEVATKGPRTWYLPHFGVINPHKPKKLRVVFDAAAEVNGVSLNSMLLRGPEQAKPLLSVLFQFRQGVVGVAADIEEMFSQIKIVADDTDAQRFLWRDGLQDQPIRTYVMTSMIFGAACSPCAAEYIKNLNANSFKTESPEAVEAIVNNHYVDDFVCSFPSPADATSVSLDVKRIHAEGGFTLRNFVCNVKAVQEKLNNSSCTSKSSVYSLKTDNNNEKVLGMHWNTDDDTFRFRLNFNRIAKEVLHSSRPPTKRELLGIVMAIFDPYGFLADYIIYSKLLLQSTWQTGIGWDDPLPDHLTSRWRLWWTELDKVSQFRVDRCYSPNLLTAEKVELHIFTDASESAFAAVGYFRVKWKNQVDVAFIAGKTRCAPKKPLSIPRLELQAAVLGSRLQSTIKAIHSIVISRVVYWSDSKTTISWIQSSQRRFKPFVAHRIAEILDASEPSDWHWIPTDLNVADDATRAANPPVFNMKGRWLSGPEFLRLPEQQWPHCFDYSIPEMLEEELRPKLFHITQASSSLIDVANFSSFSKVRRIIAWVLRSFAPLRRARERIAEKENGMSTRYTRLKRSCLPVKELTAEEILAAEKLLCRQAQQDIFHHEILSLRTNKAVSKHSAIYRLTPFLDPDGLLRLNGRIDAALCLPADARRPLILPQKHPLTQLVVYHYHHIHHHQNDALTINQIRQRYWVPRLKSVLRNIKRDCYRCKLGRIKPATPLMGQLPEDRLTPFVRPFTYSGLDYFGPLQVTIGRRREKRWVALFTCLTIRAIHLELAADLSTDAFILCLRNFINRRGTPVRIRSDNATNFIGAQKELTLESRLFDFNRIQSEMSSKGIDWRFICPLNPSEGGAWERMVQSVKKVLMVTVREEAPRVETLRSLLIEAENIVNSRPLTALPLTSEEDEPLTPNHFLLGCTNSTQTPNLDDSPICCRKQWRISQQLKDRFWKRWIQEYLPMLTRRSKWYEAVPPLEVGSLVIICDASQPRSKWQRGRIEAVYPAKDGQVRSAKVKTSQGIFRRPVSKLAVLQVCGESLQEFTEGGMSKSTRFGSTDEQGEPRQQMEGQH